MHAPPNRATIPSVAGSGMDSIIIPLMAARAVPEVLSLQTLLGRVDVRMEVLARDLAHYREIYRTRILALPHIAEIEALMLVSDIKNSEALPI